MTFRHEAYSIAPGHLRERLDCKLHMRQANNEEEVHHELTIQDVNYKTIARLGALHSNRTGQVMDLREINILDVVRS